MQDQIRIIENDLNLKVGDKDENIKIYALAPNGLKAPPILLHHFSYEKQEDGCLKLLRKHYCHPKNL